LSKKTAGYFFFLTLLFDCLKKEQKRLAERYERKQANLGKKAGGGGAEAILGKGKQLATFSS
jgi:hypothetical protein